jgi:hypothetical protein
VTAKKRSTRWHAVTVVLHDTSCAAAALCRNMRFLSHEAPHLPLPECPNSANCRCVYKHFEDRRANPRRTTDLGGALPSETPKTNRRQARGRRAQDKH